MNTLTYLKCVHGHLIKWVEFQTNRRSNKQVSVQLSTGGLDSRYEQEKLYSLVVSWGYEHIFLTLAFMAAIMCNRGYKDHSVYA